MASGNVGNALLPIVAGAVAAYATWRYSFWLVAPMFVLVTVLLWILVPGRSDEEKESNGEISLRGMHAAVGNINRAIRKDGILRVTLVQIIMAVAYQGFVAFYPTYLIDVKGLSPTLATTLFGLFFSFAIVVQPIAGGLQDRIGAKPTLLALVSVFFVSLAGLWFANGLLSLIVLTLLLSSRTGTGVINNTFIANKLPEVVKSSGLGFLRTSWIAIGALAPVAIGALGDQGALKEGFMLLAATAGIGLLVVFVIPDAE